jgi:murein DD-endopeptidase MepM/ murein hydrolase activator NlpD
MAHRSKSRRHHGIRRDHHDEGAAIRHDGADDHRDVVGTDFTLGHGGRQFRVGPVAFWICVGTLVVMATWSVVTATYFAFRDDFLTRLIARQAEMQYAYEDRIAELRSQVDRLASRQLLDQEQYEQKLDQVVRRQSTLESRAAMLVGAPDMAPTGSIKAPARAAVSVRPPPAGGKPSPINDTVILVPPPDREALLESRPLPFAGVRPAMNSGGAGIETALARLQSSLDRVDATETATLNALEERYDGKVRRMRGILADLGLDLGKIPPPKAMPSAMGGPFVPMKPGSPDIDAFERQLYRVNLARGQVEQLTRTLVAVPIRKPVEGELDTTSGFGMRMDPFLRSPAMHTGLDFRGETGDPVRATATGIVSHAGWSGGYGRMVEVDHGNGFSTRYGHLSAIDVEVGQAVRIGQIVGRLGTTGRSTGPHLHYETRVDGDAVDPQKFLRAGIRLGSAQ